MGNLILHPETAALRSGVRERRCVVERSDSAGVNSRELLYFRFPDVFVSVADFDCESYLLATVMSAMREGRSLEVRGEVTDVLLANLTEFIHAWHCWLPREYALIDIIAETVRNENQGKSITGQSVCMFSGGVDASAMVWSHVQRLRGWQNKKIALALFVHGMDIPLSAPEMFERAFRRSEETLEKLNIPLVPLKTNLRHIGFTDWLHQFGTGLAACLLNFKHYGDTGLIASNEPYNALMFPVGSSPVSDHLFSSRDMRVIHDGSAFTRMDKIRQISDWHDGMSTLRVCWEGDNKWENCGLCEKCMRTKFNFIVIGLDPPSSLGSKIRLRDILCLKIKSRVLLNEWKQIYLEARKNRVLLRYLIILKCILYKETFKIFLRDLERRSRKRQK